MSKRNRIPGLSHWNLDLIYPGGFTFRDEANAIVAKVFRNGPIEELHAGRVVDIPPDVSRISDEEMKTIMIHACRVLEEVLMERHYRPEAHFAETIAFGKMYCSGWHRMRSEDQEWLRSQKRSPSKTKK